MPGPKQYMRPGVHNGVVYGVELCEIRAEQFVIEALYVGRRRTSADHVVLGCEFKDIEAAFAAGTAAAMDLIERQTPAGALSEPDEV